MDLIRKQSQLILCKDLIMEKTTKLSVIDCINDVFWNIEGILTDFIWLNKKYFFPYWFPLFLKIKYIFYKSNRISLDPSALPRRVEWLVRIRSSQNLKINLELDLVTGK